MHLPRSSKLTPNLQWREAAGSTNLELIQLVQAEPLPDFTVLATANQQAGRGRSGRVWETAPNTALAISVLLRPRLDSQEDMSKLGWLPLLGGLAMSQTVQELLGEGHETGVKWPNDVLVAGQKICGVLSELVPLNGGGDASRFGSSVGVVIGAGINLSQTREQLPVETATSLTLAGAELPFSLEERFDLVLSGYLERLSYWYQRFTDARLSAVVSGLRQAVIDNCVTLGQPVRAILPGDTEQLGKAVTIDDSGRLVLEADGVVWPVAAGDIVHLRHN
ncbi:MAG: biotin--[acetyl-CoA-carboxylase] ligase [Actinomycetales bacterium]|nr:biotin--[acetyl-CoA-carboxylase] ligase [Actinomycetales bacterium]